MATGFSRFRCEPSRIGWHGSGSPATTAVFAIVFSPQVRPAGLGSGLGCGFGYRRPLPVFAAGGRPVRRGSPATAQPPPAELAPVVSLIIAVGVSALLASFCLDAALSAPGPWDISAGACPKHLNSSQHARERTVPNHHRCSYMEAGGNCSPRLPSIIGLLLFSLLCSPGSSNERAVACDQWAPQGKPAMDAAGISRISPIQLWTLFLPSLLASDLLLSGWAALRHALKLIQADRVTSVREDMPIGSAL